MQSDTLSRNRVSRPKLLRKQVLNQDLWKALDMARLENVKLEYVKGHSGDPDNDRVDKIAVSFSKRIEIKLRNE